MKQIINITRVALVTLALFTVPHLIAQSTNEPGTATKRLHSTNQVDTAEKKRVAGPFHGKLLELDKSGKTIKVGKRSFQITSETKIKKAGKPATLQDGIVGEPVSGYVKPTQDGKWVAVSVNFGPKVQENSAEKKSKATSEAN